jgi:hypothetical protein
MDQPEFDIETIDPPHLYSHGQKQMACAFAMAIWADSGEGDRRKFVLCEPPALKEPA